MAKSWYKAERVLLEYWRRTERELKEIQKSTKKVIKEHCKSKNAVRILRENWRAEKVLKSTVWELGECCGG